VLAESIEALKTEENRLEENGSAGIPDVLQQLVAG